ncbi:RNA polymerase sigma factor SigF, partial [Streptomyces collinus]
MPDHPRRPRQGGEGLLAGLPDIPPYEEVGAVDARALSKTLFERL